MEDVKQIREMAASGVKKVVLAKKFGIAYPHVFAVINGKKCYWWV